ncbi:MAG: hypothetical protein LH631_05105 [Alkalinema sp. CAN_BIN05]|nr:hypothetical protein [Alkalinema sp. CAN_BIN05]
MTEALNICEQMLGEKHPDTVNSREGLQAIQQAIELIWQRQEQDILQILPLLNKSLGPDHPITQTKRRELEELRMKN